MITEVSAKPMSPEAENVLAKLFAAYLTGKIRLGNNDRSDKLFELEVVIDQFKDVLGEEGYKSMAADWRQNIHVVINMLFDAVCELKKPSDYTMESLQALPTQYRVMTEMAVMPLIGKGGRDSRWNDELHRVRLLVDNITKNSRSKVTKEEIRVSFNGVVHKTVDIIMDDIYK
jgi:hypothetical protein